MSIETVQTIWWISILILLVVTGVVAILLTLILRSGINILGVAGDIWTQGQMVANNTIHIPLLRITNRVAGDILATAVKIIGGAKAIEEHAAGCPGCPHCCLEQ